MTKIFNKFFYVLKFILHIVSFILTLFILLYMYDYLQKQPLGKDFWEFFQVLIPFIILIILYVVDIILKRKEVNDDIFYNVTCTLVSCAILFMIYRAFKDPNMILKYKTSYNINFDYFADQIFQIKAMLYGLSFTNVMLLIYSRLNKKKQLDFMD